MCSLERGATGEVSTGRRKAHRPDAVPSKTARVDSYGERYVARAKEENALGHPYLGVSILSCVEYADWLSRTRYEGRYRFRLPSDLEWERAARGADRRNFVWGDYPQWAYCHSGKGKRPQRRGLREGGSFPTDESVFGVRDLAGSLSEPTTGVAFGQLYVLRGGSHETLDDRDFRLASRNWRHAGRYYSDLGLRLVVEVGRE